MKTEASEIPTTEAEAPSGGTEGKSTAGGDNWSDRVKAIGGLVAVAIGVMVVGVIAIVALSVNTPNAATIASSTAGVIATIVGAYFGVKVGTDQSKSTLKGLKAEAAKAQVYAAHLSPQGIETVMDRAEKAARRAVDIT